MPSARVGSRRYAQGLWGLSLLMLALFIAPSASVAAPLRGFEGEYIIIRPDPSRVVGVQSSSGPVGFSGGSITVREDLGHDTQVISTLPGGSAQGAFSNSEGRVIDLDPKDPTCARLVAEGVAKACSPNYEVRVATTPNDPSFGSLWGLSAASGINAPRAWDLSEGSSSVVVAIIDTGIDYNHPDLVNNIWSNPQEIAGNLIDDDGNGYIDDVHGINAATGAANPGDPLDDHGHGTHVAGTIGAEGDNSVGVVGVMQHVKLMGLKFLRANGSGGTSDAIKAIDYLVDLKLRGDVNVRVVNNSWGGGGYSEPLKAAIERANDAGIIFVAAAGNATSDNDTNAAFPASYEVPNVVSVAAISSSQQLANFSNYGATSVHIAAPGVGILSTTPSGAYQSLSGTSMATPHVSGALGLLLAFYPSLTNMQAIQRLYEAGREIPGLVNSGTGLRYVSTKRTLDVGRMLHGDIAPIPAADEASDLCPYQVQTANLLHGGELDTSADTASIVNAWDEGGFFPVDLPFDFQFFGGTLRRVYISPNGVIYRAVPPGYDYTNRMRASINSIAALHTDLIPRGAGQGVRVATGPDKVTIVWSSEMFDYPGLGVVTTRATLKASGEVAVSVAFAETGAVGSLRRRVLGDPTASPAWYPAAAIGITGPAASNAFPVALDSTLTELGIGPSTPLILGATLTPLCSVRSPNPNTSPPEAAPGGGSDDGVDGSPVVSSLRLRRVSGGREARRGVRFSGSLEGRGSAEYSLKVYLDRRECSGTASVRLAEGTGVFTAHVPSQVSRLGVAAAGRRASVYLPRALGTGSRLAAREHARACRSVIRSIR